MGISAWNLSRLTMGKAVWCGMGMHMHMYVCVCVFIWEKWGYKKIQKRQKKTLKRSYNLIEHAIITNGPTTPNLTLGKFFSKFSACFFIHEMKIVITPTSYA